MRLKRVPIKNLFSIHLWLCFCVLLAGIASPAYSVTLTRVERLFEITHDLRAPTDVAVSRDGLVYVVDGVNDAVKIFNDKGIFISTLGEHGSDGDAFDTPLGIALDSTGKVYVADTGNHRVQIFDPDGTPVTSIKIPPGNLHMADPTDVVVDDTRNRCYVVDNDNHRILVYHLKTFELLQSFGKPGTQRREFRYPFFAAISKGGYLHVVDVLNTRVQVLSDEGFFVMVIGGWGVEKGEFFRPKGIAIDKRGYVYVSDSYLGVIQVFDETGDFHSVIGDRREKSAKKFRAPMGIFVDNHNRLYVVETLADKVSVYRIEGDIP